MEGWSFTKNEQLDLLFDVFATSGELMFFRIAWCLLLKN